MARTANGVTTLYFGGLWEQAVGGAATKYYTFNGQIVAMRNTATDAVTFLHGDHLGSVSLATTSAGTLVSRQYYDPFGSVRGGSAPTARNYTGQRLDGTALLYYHARYYDPALGRFLSPDSVVPAAANGSLDGIALKALTVSFHETALLARLNAENNGGDARLYRGGPLNPQALNRYSYVLNNPVNATDPTGHAQADESSRAARTRQPSKSNPYEALLGQHQQRIFLMALPSRCVPMRRMAIQMLILTTIMIMGKVYHTSTNGIGLLMVHLLKTQIEDWASHPELIQIPLLRPTVVR